MDIYKIMIKYGVIRGILENFKLDPAVAKVVIDALAQHADNTTHTDTDNIIEKFDKQAGACEVALNNYDIYQERLERGGTNNDIMLKMSVKLCIEVAYLLLQTLYYIVAHIRNKQFDVPLPFVVETNKYGVALQCKQFQGYSLYNFIPYILLSMLKDELDEDSSIAKLKADIEESLINCSKSTQEEIQNARETFERLTKDDANLRLFPGSVTRLYADEEAADSLIDSFGLHSRCEKVKQGN